MKRTLFEIVILGGLALCLAGGANLWAEQDQKPPSQQPVPAQTKPAEAKPAEQKPAEQKPAEAKSGEQKPETPPAAAPAQPATPAATARISLQLQNADLLQVVNIIATELGMNYIVDPMVQGKVTISTLGELRREDLLPILEAILRINGATAIRSGNFFRIVPLAKAPQVPTEISRERIGSELPLDDRMILEVVPLRFASAADVGKILGEFVGEGGKVVVHEQGNVLLILDTSLNMKRLLGLIEMFDSEVFAGERVRLFPVKNNQASSLAKELETIFAAYALSEKRSALRFVPIDRINSILVVSATPESYPEVEKWIQKLDTPVVQAGVQTFVYKVRNGEATNLAKILAQLYTESYAPTTTGREGRGAGPASAAEAMPASVPEMRIVPDAVNNMLIIQTTAQNYERLKQALGELDITPRQVLIEAKVYEVNLNGSLSFGVSAFLQARNAPNRQQLPGGGLKGRASFDAAGILSGGFGTLIGQSRELLLFLNASENRSRVKVLSAPMILASDNTEAKIQVGAEVPILTSQAVVGGAQAGGTSLFSNTVQNRDTGVILRVKPRINAGGLVTLDIAQEVSTPQAPPAAAIQSPTIQKRVVGTQVVVQDGETIAIGGIMQENIVVSKNRVPLLGDVPVLGTLFGNTSYTKQRTELIVTITPRVIADMADVQVRTEELKAKLKELKKTFKRME